MIYLTRCYRFSASHRLHNPKLSPARNQLIYGKCNNERGHGHNYTLEVTVAGEPRPETGMVADLAELDEFVQRRVLDRFDFAFLNDDAEAFGHAVPTTENLCRAIYHLLEKQFLGAQLDRVRLEETSRNAFEFAGNREGQP